VRKSFKIDKEDLKIAIAVFIGFVAIGGVIVWYEKNRIAPIWNLLTKGKSADELTREGGASFGTDAPTSYDDETELDSMKCMWGPWNVCQPRTKKHQRSGDATPKP